MQASPIRSNILFCFLNQTNSGSGTFTDSTKSGVLVSTILDSQAAGRWAKALLVGPECVGIKVGQYIFIQPLMWTTGFDFDGIKIWKTDESKILAVSDEIPEYQVS